MGIVAPVTGVLAAVIPVVAGFVTEGIPQPVVLVGIVLAVVAVVLVSRVADESGGREGLAEALAGGTAIGLFGVAIAQLSEGDVFADLATIRVIQGLLVAIAVVATRSAWRPGRLLLPLVLIGALDTAGNGFYLAAVQTGQLAIASVLSAMYPVVTVILAAVVLREPVTRDHAIGIGLAGAAIALIGAGGS
jgi:drug/metabolite transporter (DMT)-like permease